MSYEDFVKVVREKSIYETIYEDTEGRVLLVIGLLDAYALYTQLTKDKANNDHR